MKVKLISITDGEKSEKSVDGEITLLGDFVRISYTDTERESDCTLTLSKSDTGFLKIREKGDVNVILDIANGRGVSSVSSGGFDFGKIPVSGFMRTINDGVISISYEIHYSEGHTGKISLNFQVGE